MKIELYKAYKTRGGYKAVVVEMNPTGTFKVYHLETEGTYYHDSDGLFCTPKRLGKEFDLVSEWIEPQSGHFWVNVYECGVFDSCSNEEEAKRHRREDCIATKHIFWKSGDTE